MHCTVLLVALFLCIPGPKTIRCISRSFSGEDSTEAFKIDFRDALYHANPEEPLCYINGSRYSFQFSNTVASR